MAADAERFMVTVFDLLGSCCFVVMRKENCYGNTEVCIAFK
jgi:hypothetical protein